MMKERGFVKVSASKIGTEHMMGKTWYKPTSRTLITDAKPDNFKKGADGRGAGPDCASAAGGE